MAATSGKGLKQNLLIIFLVVSILLIGLIWAGNLAGPAPETPGYYRDTYRVDQSIYVTATAEAIENELRQKSGTPVPEQGEGHGQGRGGGQNEGKNH